MRFVWLSMRSKPPLIVCTCCFIIMSLFLLYIEYWTSRNVKKFVVWVLKRIIKCETASEEVSNESF